MIDQGRAMEEISAATKVCCVADRFIGQDTNGDESIYNCLQHFESNVSELDLPDSARYTSQSVTGEMEIMKLPMAVRPGGVWQARKFHGNTRAIEGVCFLR